MYSLKSLGLEDDEEEAFGKSDGVGNFPKEFWRIFWVFFLGEKNPRRFQLICLSAGYYKFTYFHP